MRSEGVTVALSVALVMAFVGIACKADAPGASSPAPASTPAAGRFAAVPKKVVKGKAAAEAAKRFCEKSYPAKGKGRRVYTPAPGRPLPGAVPAPAPAPTAPTAPRPWTWVNVWATWCAPCMEEMALLGRWRQGMASAAAPFDLELLSVDTVDAQAALAQTIAKGLPGPVRWLRSSDDLAPFMSSLGVAAEAALPVHALVDPSGALRCVRVGAIHDRDYGAVKALLTGG